MKTPAQMARTRYHLDALVNGDDTVNTPATRRIYWSYPAVLRAAKLVQQQHPTAIVLVSSGNGWGMGPSFISNS